MKIWKQETRGFLAKQLVGAKKEEGISNEDWASEGIYNSEETGTAETETKPRGGHAPTQMGSGGLRKMEESIMGEMRNGEEGEGAEEMSSFPSQWTQK